ncbi:MAG TPA: Gfo/Idh/MocA family oxidoreductase [Verrucomicrobiae bacterium]|nr:Gfo/Idh/MocA family oxidoreductase [Verrucomicrobiae bacterium]
MMPLSRRAFLQRAALAGAALSTGCHTVRARPHGPTDVLGCVQVGCGIRSATHLEQVIVNQKQKLLALVDPDEHQLAQTKKWLEKKGVNVDQTLTFNDYRVMFDKIGKQADAVFVTTPNHHHAVVSIMALQAGCNVYCEKPVSHTIGEARLMRAQARHFHKLATQMGNQGHCMEGYRLLCEYIWSGAIGAVTETHSWTNRANGGEGPRPPSKPAPPGMNWDAWIGPAPYRDYHDDLHPHEWHGWYDFGNGSIGNMGCHILDGVFWALKCEHPTSIECEQIRGGSDERYPLGSRIRWDVPARAGLPAFKAYWYEGLNETTTATPRGTTHAATGDARNLPPILGELQKKYPDDYFGTPDGGTLYIGEKGVIFTGTYGEKMHILPLDSMSERPKPPQILARPADIFTDFVQACRAGRSETSAPFEYGTRLTEFSILGNLAQKAGLHQKVEWDGPNMKVTNIPELNHWVQRENRKGWGTT